ncbi:MAG: siphovirus Gp157 family protein [Eubacteriales bacterium]|nr:siphovirus Gp157 family protein [Eubacteriales bacterium]
MSNTLSLYELSQCYRDAFDNLEIDEATGEITNFADVDFLDSSFEDKAINCALYIKGLDAEIEAYKTEEERLKNWRKAAEKKRESFMEYIESCMDEVGKTKIQDPRARLSFRKSEQLIVDDPDMLPRKFIVVKTEEKPDKTAIKAAIKAGTEISGAHIENCRNLQIK